ncbi:MAG: M48 family metallopeptidase [Thermodesulfobacteriota bacterium]
MQYQPVLPEENNNISHIHPLRDFATLLAGTLATLFLLYLILGLLVDRAVNHISPATELKIFSHTPAAWAGPETEEEDERLAKVQGLTQRLALSLEISVPITVHIADVEAVNAVALPGGHIVVFAGLLERMKTENGLGFILAHELGHFKNRDHLRGLGRGLVLMAMAATLTGPDSSLTQLVTPTMQLGQARYSQGREFMADEVGLRGVQALYGHVGGATELFELIGREEGDGLPLSHYFASHPQTAERLARLADIAGAAGWQSLSPIALTF